MIPRRVKRHRRPAATMVETAVVASVTLVTLFALVVGGLGVMRYQQVAALARESARAASVRGGQFRQDAGLPPGTSATWSADLYSNGVLRVPSDGQIDVRTLGLSPGALTYAAAWPDGDNWPYRVTTDNGQAVGNRVRVTVAYRWLPEALFGGITLSSTAEMQITN